MAKIVFTKPTYEALDSWTICDEDALARRSSRQVARTLEFIFINNIITINNINNIITTISIINISITLINAS